MRDYLEDKELWFKDFILKSHPEILTNGVFCPSKSFWWEQFLPAIPGGTAPTCPLPTNTCSPSAGVTRIAVDATQLYMSNGACGYVLYEALPGLDVNSWKIFGRFTTPVTAMFGTEIRSTSQCKT